MSALGWTASRLSCAPPCFLHRCCCLVNLLSPGPLLRELHGHTAWCQGEEGQDVPHTNLSAFQPCKPELVTRSRGASVSCSAQWAL